MIRYATVTVSPALKLGCCLPVANASSATLIKSIVIIIKLFHRYNATYQASHYVLTAIARKRCKGTNYLSDTQTIHSFLFIYDHQMTDLTVNSVWMKHYLHHDCYLCLLHLNAVFHCSPYFCYFPGSYSYCGKKKNDWNQHFL